MGKPQMITTEAGERLVVLTERDYLALRASAGDEEAEDAMTVVLAGEAQARLTAGEDVLIPSDTALAIAMGTAPLAAIRKWRGLTQAGLADKAGVSQVMISQIESRRRIGSMPMLRALAAALDVPVSVLIEDSAPQDRSRPPTGA